MDSRCESLTAIILQQRRSGFKNIFPDLKENVHALEEAIKGSDSSCVQVQFEDFVMDRSYREGLAKYIGLDLDIQREYTSFKPWQSARNVFIHETHGDPSDIKLLEEDLSEYCIDLEQYREEAARLEAIARERGE